MYIFIQSSIIYDSSKKSICCRKEDPNTVKIDGDTMKLGTHFFTCKSPMFSDLNFLYDFEQYIGLKTFSQGRDSVIVKAPLTSKRKLEKQIKSFNKKYFKVAASTQIDVCGIGNKYFDIDFLDRVDIMRDYIYDYQGSRIFEDFADHVGVAVDDVIDDFTDAEYRRDIYIEKSQQENSEYAQDDIYDSENAVVDNLY